MAGWNSLLRSRPQVRILVGALMRTRVLSLLLAATFLASGCGSDEGPRAPDVERAEETFEKPPKLPRGFDVYENRTAGITFGRPPGWDVAEDGVLTVIRAPDELVVLSVSVDRTGEALAGEPGSFATETAKLLPGYRRPLDPSKPKPFEHRYPGSSVTAEGIADGGFEQRVEVIVLEREGAAVVTAVVAENAEEGARAEVRQALESVASLRTQPVG